MTIGERLAEFYRRLSTLPAAQSASEALDQISQTLEEVEDQLRGIPKQSPPPPPDMPDGRMYPPLANFTRTMPGGGMEARTRGHVIHLGPGGSIGIRNKRNGAIEFEKPGAATE
jgi:hypothetical protein